MKTSIKTSMLAAALSFGLVACDGPAENAMEDAGVVSETQEDAMTERAENTADAMEEQGEAMDEGTTAPM